MPVFVATIAVKMLYRFDLEAAVTEFVGHFSNTFRKTVLAPIGPKGTRRGSEKGPEETEIGFLQREFERLNGALGDPNNANKYEVLYAAQQAVAWATDPAGYKSPFDTIMGTPVDSKDYSARSRQPESSNNLDHCD